MNNNRPSIKILSNVIFPLTCLPLILAGALSSGHAAEFTNVSTDREILTRFEVAVSDVLCNDIPACGSDALLASNWFIVTDDGSYSLGVASVEFSGTNIVLSSSLPRVNAHIYKVGLATNGTGLFDVTGNLIPPGSFVRTRAVFQEGFGGYAGTQDTYLDVTNPDVANGASNTVSVRQGSATPTSPVLHALLRFDNVFGSSGNEIPYGASIKQAKLYLANETIDDTTFAWFPMHRMKADWDQSSTTWNSIGGGVGYVSYVPDVTDTNKVEPAVDSLFRDGGGFPLVAPRTGVVDVTTSVRAWANGYHNRGWAIIPTDQDGAFDKFGFASSEHEIPDYRPRLEIDYVVARLRIHQQGSMRVIEWQDRSFVLQSSISLAPATWQTIHVETAGHYEIPVTDTQRYFRLCSGCE